MATLNLMAPPGPGGPPPALSNGVLDLNQTNCEMVQCGAIPQAVFNAAVASPPGLPPMPFASACTAAGYGGPQGGRYYNDPTCQPWAANILASGPSGQTLEECVALGGQYNADGSCTMPSATQSTMPSITDTANTVVPSTPQPILTPQYLTQKMPSIVNPAPMGNPAPACAADPVTQWVSDNPMLAAAGLALCAWMVFGKK